MPTEHQDIPLPLSYDPNKLYILQDFLGAYAVVRGRAVYRHHDDVSAKEMASLLAEVNDQEALLVEVEYPDFDEDRESELMDAHVNDWIEGRGVLLVRPGVRRYDPQRGWL